MEKNIIAVLGTIVVVVIFANCDDALGEDVFRGEGEVISREIKLEHFNKIDLQGATNISIYESPIQKIIATGHSNIIDRFSTFVYNDKWEARLKNGVYKDDLSIDVYIPTLGEIINTGSGTMVIYGFKNQEDLLLDLAGSGNIELNKFAGCEKLTCNLSGSGHLRVNDNWEGLKNTKISISGSGAYLGYSLQTENASINISGSGLCEVNAEKKLDVSISGSGSVFYHGSPTVSSSIIGSGSVQKTD